MGCCNSLNSVHPSSQPVGETNPSFGIQDACTTDTDHGDKLEFFFVFLFFILHLIFTIVSVDLPLVAPNSSPERPVRHNGVGKVRSSVSPALEALSQLENNKTFYRPKLVKQFGLPSSSSSDETDGRYSNGVQLFRSNGSQLSQVMSNRKEERKILSVENEGVALNGEMRVVFLLVMECIHTPTRAI